MTLAAAGLSIAQQARRPGSTGFFQVLAEGEITPDTPAAFTDYLNRNGPVHLTLMFNSPGGDLTAGLARGREIRRAGWSTNIGTPGLSPLASNPGECDSACTFAFLGGRIRSMAFGSKYGVHRFWGQMVGDVQQTTQQVAGELVAYIREMGVSAEMYTLMTQGEPDHVKYLDPDTMTRLRITTKEVVDAKMADENGVAVVHATDGDSGGTIYSHMDFFCNGPRFLARVHFLPPLIAFNAAQFFLKWVFTTLAYTAEREISIPPAEYRYRGQNASEIWIDVNVPRALLEDWILPANTIGVKLIQIPGTSIDVQQDRVGSFVTPLPAAFRSLVQTMEKACH